MRFFSRLVGRRPSTEPFAASAAASRDLLDGSLDTLDCFLRAISEFDVPLDDEDPRFHDLCKSYARHVTNGAAVFDEGIDAAPDGQREWGRVRRFFLERRQRESEFVSHRISNYRMLVEDLVVGMRAISTREELTESQVRKSISAVESAAISGDVKAIRATLAETMNAVVTAFDEQRRLFEAQITMANAKMHQLRKDLANRHEQLKRDPLTDAYNRAAFDLAMEQAIAMNFVLRQPIVVVMIDVDHLSTVNERGSKLLGDDVLRSVADCLARCFVRRTDLIARYGGDEFALILRDITTDRASQLLNNFLDLVRETISTPAASGLPALSCSVGFTAVQPADTVVSALERANRALFEAKQQGRDRVCLKAAEITH